MIYTPSEVKKIIDHFTKSISNTNTNLTEVGLRNLFDNAKTKVDHYKETIIRIEEMKKLTGQPKIGYEGILAAINRGKFPDNEAEMEAAKFFYDLHFTSKTKSHSKKEDSDDGLLGGPRANRLNKILGIKITIEQYKLLKERFDKASFAFKVAEEDIKEVARLVGII